MPQFSHIPSSHPTPSLVIDLPTVRQNLNRMGEYGKKHQLQIRPHTKTHKSKRMAQLQLDSGASGLTVAKAGEAAVMASVTSDIFIAYPAIGEARLQRIVEIARNAKVRLAADSHDSIALIQDAARSHDVRLDMMIDIDVGFHRTGVEGPASTLELARSVMESSHLNMLGIMCFPGHLKPNSPSEAWEAYESDLGEIVETLRDQGIPVDVVSGGSTPTACSSHRNRWLTEIRPGTYIYNDMNEVRLGVATLEDCAAHVLATVVSHSGKNKFVVDAGSKMLSSDRCGPAPDSGWGYVVEFPEAKVVRLSEEHGEIELNSGSIPKIGSRVSIIPNHICVCVNLQEQAWLQDGNELVALPIDARGLVV